MRVIRKPGELIQRVYKREMAQVWRESARATMDMARAVLDMCPPREPTEPFRSAEGVTDPNKLN